MALGGVPKPIGGTVFQPQRRAALVKSSAYSQHAWLVFPSGQQLAAFRLVYCYSSHDRKTIGIQSRRYERLLITEPFPRRRHTDRPLHTVGIHYLQEFLVTQWYGSMRLG